jgi:phosphocarrier protein HPr
MDKVTRKNVPETLEQKFVVGNKLGLHARPAALLVQTANSFQSEITIQKGKQKVNAKSIMGVLMLAAGSGSIVIICIIGLDARKAMVAISKLFQQNFQE